jgi:hypothetical protein
MMNASKKTKDGPEFDEDQALDRSKRTPPQFTQDNDLFRDPNNDTLKPRFYKNSPREPKTQDKGFQYQTNETIPKRSLHLS